MTMGSNLGIEQNLTLKMLPRWLSWHLCSKRYRAPGLAMTGLIKDIFWRLWTCKSLKLLAMPKRVYIWVAYSRL